MNREILFRGWSKKENEWLYGRYTEDTIHTQPPSVGDGCIEWWGYIVDEESVGQYTGLKDKNGKRIFEGDVVETPLQRAVVKYKSGCFYLIGIHKDKYEKIYNKVGSYLLDGTLKGVQGSKWDGITTVLKIIGNVYNYPELLEVIK